MSSATQPQSPLVSKALELYETSKKNDKVAGKIESIIRFWIKHINESYRLTADAISSNMERIVEALKKNYHVIVAEARAVENVRPGIGNLLLPLEWGLTVHPIYRVPYIPGSSIKGVLRAVYQDRVAKSLDPDTANKCADIIFGSTSEGISLVTAFDAYPLPGSRGIVGPDIITPHMRPGEKGVISELDLEPVPVKGVSIRPGTRFKFTLKIDNIRGEMKNSIPSDCLKIEDIISSYQNIDPLERLRNIILYILILSLKYIGIGGRTLKGYGRFEIEKIEII